MTKKFVCSILILLISLSLFGSTFAQTQDAECEQCGMIVDSVGQQRFSIVDSQGNSHVVCCPVCALKLLTTYETLTITSFCDYRGPDYPITISATKHGANVVVNPSTALVIVGGSCTTNRLVHDSSAADALLSSSNNGTSQWLSPLSNDPVAKNATRLSINQAAIKYSGLTLDSTTCEACGMTVSAESQTRYRITDGQANPHYVECFMCALELINKYDTLHIETTCDWYGPGYPIIIDSKGYGQTATVTPSTAVFLRGGSCVTARVAYNQTAADNLLAYGYSKNTSPEQQYTLPTKTEIKTVADAIQTWYAQPINNTPSTLVFVAIVAIGVIITALAILTFKKLKVKQ